jgi:cytoskeletal protein CcmA (bactofilin family)
MLRHLLLVVCTALPASGIAQSESPAPNPAARAAMAERVQGDDHFVAGGSIRVVQPVAGDLIAAGGTVDVDATVNGDAVVAGGTVRITGAVGDSLYAGGGQLTLEGPVGRNARIGGGRVEIRPKASIAGGVSVGGGEVRVDGVVKGYVQAAGGRVWINGPVGGDVVATGGVVELGPDARIAGKLRYGSRSELQRDPAAQVAGGVERVSIEIPAGRAQRSVDRGGGFVWTAGLMLIAALLVGALPAFTTRVATTLHTRIGMSFLLGFVALACVPVAVLILLITLIGIPLALLTLVLYFALLITGYVMTGIGIGDWVLGRYRAADASRTGWRIGAAVITVLVIAVLARIPFVGGVITLAALLAGVGALVMQARRASAAA